MPGRRPRVVYWNHSPTPYFVARFNAVNERGSLDFEAWFNVRRESMRSWDVTEAEWNFPARYIPQRRFLGWPTQIPAAELRVARPDLLVQEYDRAHLMGGFLTACALSRRTAFRVLPNFDSWSERTWWREAAKRYAFRVVDAAKVPGQDGAALAARYGLDPTRVHSVTQSVDLESLRPTSPASTQDRSNRRAELGLEGCVFVYSGRLWSGKGTDDLFDAYEDLVGEGRRVSLLMLGDGMDEARYKARAETLPGVVFAGFVQASEIGRYYGLADAMVFPTLGDPHGLVVEEAMAAGLPVIASAAAGDIATRLPDGDAGFIIAPHDHDALAQRMRALADDPALRERMGLRASELAGERDHSRYAEEFEAFVLKTLSAPRRSGLAATSARFGGRSLAALCRWQDPAGPIGTGANPAGFDGARAGTLRSLTPEALAGSGLMQSAQEWDARNRILAQNMSELINRYATPGVDGAPRGLDVGCQAGALTDAMESQTPFAWTGIDPTMPEPTRSPAGLELLPASADRLPFDSESFSVALFANVYEHVLPELREASLADIRRVLVPGGYIVGQIPNPYFPIESHSRLPFMGWLPMPAQKVYWRLSPVPWEHDFFVVTIREMRASAEKLGLRTIRIRNFNYPAEVIPSALRPAWRVMERPMRRMPWAWQFVFQRLD